MDQRDRILMAVSDLAAVRGELPSLADLAAQVGLTKQGVLHYFPNREALDRAVVLRAVARVDDAMQAAAAGGSPLATYLGLSSPSEEDHAAVAVIAAAMRQGEVRVPPEVAEAAERWELLIAAEVGNRTRAEIARLVGDGLFVESLSTGNTPTKERVDRLVAHLRSV